MGYRNRSGRTFLSRNFEIMSLNMNFEKELKNVESKVVIENMMKILEDRIHDNKSEMNKIIFYLLLCFLSFFLSVCVLTESITEGLMPEYSLIKSRPFFTSPRLK